MKVGGEVKAGGREQIEQKGEMGAKRAKGERRENAVVVSYRLSVQKMVSADFFLFTFRGYTLGNESILPSPSYGLNNWRMDSSLVG